MNRSSSNLHFYIHDCIFKLRDFFLPRIDILKEPGITPGFYVLDYGCGSGSYINILADMVGKTGRVYALDIHPLAIQKINGIIAKRHLINVKAIYSDWKTGLPDNSMDAVLLYDVFHVLNNEDRVLKELHRVLKPKAILSFRDHRMTKDEIVYNLTKDRFFQLSEQGKKTYTFRKI